MNLYLVLGVRREASLADIRRAYRRLARRYHPDVNPGDREAARRFAEISRAFEVLSDASRRRAYDQGEEPVPAQTESPVEFRGFDFTREVEGQRASTFAELFADVLHGRAQGASEPGADLHVTVDLTFAEAVRGGRRALTVTRLERCGPCAGRGAVPRPAGPCPACDATGQLVAARRHMVFARPCPVCRGAGQVTHEGCRACGGEAVGVRTDVVEVDLPPGLRDGDVLDVPGQGHAGRRGGPPGQLRVTVRVAPHPLYRREGDDLLIEVPIAVHEAALGARIDVPTFDGGVRVRIPPGTQAGQRFRLRGRGVRSPRTGEPGDLIVTVRIVMPRLLDERSRQLLREFGELNNEDVRADLRV